ncbi:MAG: restriction endonuclease subunit S [Clostridium sp.]|uniref:restriction endonuclease subunit S n=1 Tax=Clostridium sp. TaxID=1506 RepID=UPI003D6CAC82
MKNVREGYKITELGEIPFDWEIVNIDKVSEFVGSGVTPKGGQSVYKAEGIPFIRSQNVYPQGLFLNNIAYIDEEQNEKMKRTKIQDEDILLNITGASIGRCTLVPIGFGRGNVNQHVCIIRTTDKTNPQYISICLNSEIGKKQIDSFNGGSSREGLNFQQVRGIKLPMPILIEQQKISLILSSVDEKIENTDKLIEKSKELKKGLMQRLLTKGIGHDRFKDTETGRIPEEWEVRKMKDIIETTQLGTNAIGSNDIEKGIPMIKMGNLLIGGFNFDKVQYIKNGDFDINKEFVLKKGDFLFNTRNTLDLVGKSSTWNNQLALAIFNSNIMRIQYKIDIDSFYMSYYFADNIGWRQLKSIAKGTTSVGAIYTKDLINIKVKIPPLNEQVKIALILSSVDEKINQYQFKKEKLQELKKGLMQKLLTGKIRVKV